MQKSMYKPTYNEYNAQTIDIDAEVNALFDKFVGHDPRDIFNAIVQTACAEMAERVLINANKLRKIARIGR